MQIFFNGAMPIESLSWWYFPDQADNCRTN